MRDNTLRVKVLVLRDKMVRDMMVKDITRECRSLSRGTTLESGGPGLEGQDGEGQHLESGGPGMEGQDGEEEGVRVLYLIGG